MSERIDISINAEEVLRALDQVDDKIDLVEVKAEIVLNEIEKKTQESFNQVLNMARAGWNITQQVVKIAGGSIDSLINLSISSALSMISVYQTISAGKAMTTQNWVQFGIEMGLWASAIAQVGMAGQLKEQFEKGDMIMRSFQSISSYIGSINF